MRMTAAPDLKTSTHVVDILGNVIGRDQPIMLMEKAVHLASLLGESVYKDEGVVFFDPFCKAGEILLACALLSCKSKASDGGELLSMTTVERDLYLSSRYFALAPDERHHRLSLRTFLGNTHSHDPTYSHVIRNGNYLSEKDGRLNKEAFEKEFAAMIDYIKEKSGNKRIIAVGNPPYQESDGGYGGSAKAIYNHFVEALMDEPRISEFVLVIPSRWFTTGKGAAEFRERILQAGTIKTINHFVNSKEIFPTVNVQGGVCFMHYQADYKGGVNFINGETQTEVDISKYDIVLDDPKGYEIIGKVLNKWKGKEFVSNRAWTVRPFGIRTFYFSRKKALTPTDKNAVPCFSKRRQIKFADIRDIQRNHDKIDDWKVAVPNVYAPGTRRVTLPPEQFFIIPKGHITTETYNIVASFKKKSEAENFKSYLTTEFSRYILGLRKVTQHVYKSQWNWLPLVDVSREWDDASVYKLFGVTKEEQTHIKKMLEEWS